MDKKPTVDELISLTLKSLIARISEDPKQLSVPGLFDRCIADARLQYSEASQPSSVEVKDLSQAQHPLGIVIPFPKKKS